MSSRDLEGALALTGAEACRAYYRDWAERYDAGFAAEMDYLLPAHVAAAFQAAGGQGPVLDIGAGTGLLAERLREMGFAGEIDAVDFSPEMLRQAGQKGIYRLLMQADITKPLPLAPQYRGVVSSGTFTAGHVGPEALSVLLAVARPGAQFALSVNHRVWRAAGFDTALAALEAAGRVAALQVIEVQVYGAAVLAQDARHAEDRAQVVLFQTT